MPPARKPINHGTMGGYQVHRTRSGGKPVKCKACLKAWAEYKRKNQAKKKEKERPAKLAGELNPPYDFESGPRIGP